MIDVPQTPLNPPRRLILARVAHLDADLLALEPELNALKAQYDIASKTYMEADEKYFAELKKLPPAWRDHPAELKRLNTKHGLDAANAANDKALRRLTEALDELIALPARTLDGLKFKARWAEDDDSIPLSIIEDLMEL